MRMNNGIADMGWLQVRARDEGRPPERLPCLLVLFNCCGNKFSEQRVRISRPGLEFRMELHANEPRMDFLRKLNDFYQSAIWQSTTDNKTVVNKLFSQIIVNFITVTMTLMN